MRFDEYKRTRRRSPGLMRVFILAALLGVVLAAMWHMRQRAETYRREAEAKRAQRPAKEVVVDPIRAADDLEERGLLRPEEERALLGRVQDQYDLAVLEQKEAYYYLIRKVRLLTLRELLDQLDPEADYGDFAVNPHLVRGAVVQIRGQLYRLDKEEMDLQASGLSHVYEGEVLATDGNLYAFVLVETPAADLKPGIVTRQDQIPVRVTGVFLQNLVYKDRRGKASAAPLIVAKEVARLRTWGAKEVGFPVWGTALIAGLVLAVGAYLLMRRPRRGAHDRATPRYAGSDTAEADGPPRPGASEQNGIAR